MANEPEKSVPAKAEQSGPFFLVWNEQREMPKRKHWFRTGAFIEAQRLANIHPGHIIRVLECIGMKYRIPGGVPTQTDAIKRVAIKPKKVLTPARRRR